MSDPTSSQRRIAMLIDGDNAQPRLMDKMIAETSKYGMVNIRRIYGDWTESEMNSWKQTLHTYAVQPIQQFRYTVGKNATDSALIIDAMDILYTAGVDGFCLVSSDSDYTKLAMRIREKNLFVMGIGRRTTPRAFVNACDTFVYTENLLDAPRTGVISVPLLTMKAKKPASPIGAQKPLLPGKQPSLLPPQAEQIQAAPPLPTPSEMHTEALADALFPDFDPDTQNVQPNLTTLMRRAFDMAVGDSGWANLGAFGSRLRQLDPGFDPRTYGYRQLALLVAAHTELFEVQRDKSKDGSSGTVAIRLKNSDMKAPAAPKPAPRPSQPAQDRDREKPPSRSSVNPFRAAEVFGTSDLEPFRFDDFLDDEKHITAGDLLTPNDEPTAHEETAPPVTIVEQPPSAPRRRGRKPKATTPPPMEVVVEAAPPPAAVAEQEPPAPRRRGRKPKAVAPVAQAAPPPVEVVAEQLPAPRRRGRKGSAG
jgi:uncharacterized LabA/DUF88 family protein